MKKQLQRYLFKKLNASTWVAPFGERVCGTLRRESGGASSMESSEDPTEDGGAGDDAEEQVAGRRRNAMRADRRGTEEVIGGIARRAGMIGGMGDEGSVWLEDGFWVEAIVLEVDGRKASCKEK